MTKRILLKLIKNNNLLSIFKSVFNLLGKKNYLYNIIYNKRFDKLSYSEKKFIIEVQFENMVNYKLNLNNPKSFNEKIQWLKLYYKNPLITKCSDKVKVREYIAENIGKKYLIPIYGIYSSVEEINFSALPNSFVIKTNWGS